MAVCFHLAHLALAIAVATLLSKCGRSVSADRSTRPPDNTCKRHVELKTLLCDQIKRDEEQSQALAALTEKVTALEQKINELVSASDKLQNVVSDTEELKVKVNNILLQQNTLSVQQPRTCEDIRQYSVNSGVYHLLLPNNSRMAVFCDQLTDGGGWTVIQRRVDGYVNFTRAMREYEEGFGDLQHEFWLGLRNIHRLTSSGVQYSLRIDLGDWDGSKAYALYDTFSVSGPEDLYRLHVASYSGTAGNSLMISGKFNHNNQAFSTPDRDNDHQVGGSCAAIYKSGWWFNNCLYANLNGLYGTAQTRDWSYVVWYHWHNDIRSYKTTEMKIRPRR